MKEIEPAKLNADQQLTGQIRDFWSRNVNAEKLMGQDVSEHGRGSNAYFKDLEQQRFRSHRHLLPWIEEMQVGRSVLELGSGVGLDTFIMASRGLKVTAVDLTTVGISAVRQRFASSGLTGNFAVADACTLPFLDNHFDYVYSFGVLHHAADTRKAINEAYRVLKPGGVARIMLYHRHSINEVVHRLTRVPFEDRDELCPVVRRFTITEVRELFSKFNHTETFLAYAFGEGYGRLFNLTPRCLHDLLSRYFGWHIMISATK